MRLLPSSIQLLKMIPQRTALPSFSTSVPAAHPIVKAIPRSSSWRALPFLGPVTGLLTVSAFASSSLSSASAAAEDASPSPAEVPVPLPMDKLTCARRSSASAASTSDAAAPQVVLLGCGSFNPPTAMHLRMFEIARDAMTLQGAQVVGAYMSPVNDGYGKKGLLNAQDRLEMCRRAARDSPMIMVDEWEARQPENQRTLPVIHRVDRALNGGTLTRDARGSRTRPNGDTRLGIVLLCGADMLASFLMPGVWAEADMHEILGTYEVVCIYRDGTDLEALLNTPGTILNRYKERITMVRDPFVNNISSTLVRQCLKEGRSVRYVVPDAVISYILEKKLYDAGSLATTAAESQQKK